MSNNNNNAAPNNNNGLLGSPLVTVSKVGVVGEGISVANRGGSIAPPTSKISAGNDHPLAVTSAAPPVAAVSFNTALPFSSAAALPDTTSKNTTAAVSNTVPSSVSVSLPPIPRAVLNKTPSSTLVKRTPSTSVIVDKASAGVVLDTSMVGPSNSSSLGSKLSLKPTSPHKRTLDALADAFMSEKNYRTSTLKLPPLLTPLPLPSNQSGIDRIRTLVERRAWGDVLQVSFDMLRNAANHPQYASIYDTLVNDSSMNKATNKPPPPPSTSLVVDKTMLQNEVVEIMSLECHAWLKLRRYTDLGREVECWSFLHPKNHNESSSKIDSSSPPTWVPWSLHILAAEALQYTTEDSSKQCLDELYALRTIFLETSNNPYILAVDASLSNVFQRIKDWRMALDSLENLLQILPSVYSGDELFAYQAEIWSRQGRILLQVGAIQQAEQIFQRMEEEEISTENQDWMILKIPIQVALHKGMIQFASQKYDKAISHLRTASKLLRSCQQKEYYYQMDNYVGPIVWRESPQLLSTQVWNNMSLCSLYLCRMNDAIATMEDLVREDPTAYLTERLAFNLCTLYELGADTASSARKKRVLQLVAKRFYLHDIGPEQFRVN